MTQEFLRGQSVYNRLIVTAVSDNCTWLINATGIIRRGKGQIAAIQQVTKILAEHKVAFRYSDILHDIKAECAKREEMMQENIITAAAQKAKEREGCACGPEHVTSVRHPYSNGI